MGHTAVDPFDMEQCRDIVKGPEAENGTNLTINIRYMAKDTTERSFSGAGWNNPDYFLILMGPPSDNGTHKVSLGWRVIFFCTLSGRLLGGMLHSSFSSLTRFLGCEASLRTTLNVCNITNFENDNFVIFVI